MSKPRLIRLLPLLAASLLLAACAGTGPATQTTADPSSQATLKERALQRWNDLIARDGAKAYDYLTPGYRNTITRETYAARMDHRPVRWKSASVTGVTCSTAGNCMVRVDVGYAATLPGMAGQVESVASIDERWLFLDGQWYNLPDRLGTALQ